MKVIDEILKLYGLAEVSGPKSNPVLIAILAKHNGPAATDDSALAWCGIMMAEAFERAGFKSQIPGGYMIARNWMQLKTETVPLEQAELGDIVIFWRGSPIGWQGHVACYVNRTGSNINVLGGNQGDRVSIAPYAMERVLAVKRQPK